MSLFFLAFLYLYTGGYGSQILSFVFACEPSTGSVGVRVPDMDGTPTPVHDSQGSLFPVLV